MSDGTFADSRTGRIGHCGGKVLIIGVPRESFPGERRVAMVPGVVPSLAKAGFQIVMEAGAGVGAGYPDADYLAKGASIVPDRAEVFRVADIIIQVLCYGSNDATGAADLPLFHRDQILIGFLRPFGSLKTIEEIAATGVTAFSRGIDAALHARAEHGCAFVDGDDFRIQSGTDCCR